MASNVEEKSRFVWIKNSIGHTNNGHTPLAAIFVSFVPGLLAFLAVGVGKPTFQEVSSPCMSQIFAGVCRPQIVILVQSCAAHRRLGSTLHGTHDLYICKFLHRIPSYAERVC